MTPAERRDPDEPDTPGTPGELSASDVETAFAQIVAGWGLESGQRPALDAVSGTNSDTASDTSSDTGSDVLAEDDTPTQALPRITPEEAAVVDPVPVDEDDDHFVPPDPPPLPRPQPATVGAVCLFVLGIVLLAIPGVIGFSSQYGLPLGLLSITGAIVWLAARLRQGPPTDSGWDDGAQL